MTGPKQQLMNALVYSEVGRSVDTVLVGGDTVLENGQIINVNTSALLEEAQELATRIWSNLPERYKAFEALRPMLEDLENAVGRLALEFSRSCG